MAEPADRIDYLTQAPPGQCEQDHSGAWRRKDGNSRWYLQDSASEPWAIDRGLSPEEMAGPTPPRPFFSGYPAEQFDAIPQPAPAWPADDTDRLAKAVTRMFFDLLRDDVTKAQIAEASRASVRAVKTHLPVLELRITRQAYNLAVERVWGSFEADAVPDDPHSVERAQSVINVALRALNITVIDAPIDTLEPPRD